MAFLRWILEELQLEFWRTLDGDTQQCLGGLGQQFQLHVPQNLQISPEYSNLCSEGGGGGTEAGLSIEKVHFFHF
jgi:hypothetical protein